MKVVVAECKTEKRQKKAWISSYVFTNLRLAYTYIGDDSVPDCDLVCSIVRVNLKQDAILSSSDC
jgi:hypothetical protein